MSKHHTVLHIAPPLAQYPMPQTTPTQTDVLLDILSTPRFARSAGEERVIAQYLLTLPNAQQDAYGNVIVDILHPDNTHATTLFACHTDTVHKAKATEKYKHRVSNGMLTVDGGGVLGADCGTGIWIMLKLIEAQIPGLYIFHRDEEIGGGGSSYIAQKAAPTVTGIKRCISFDRKSTNHVITHQAAARCCSDTFALALAEAINQPGQHPATPMNYAPNDGGSFTDSANYTLLIPECTNLSVGYYDQHTTHESQDLPFLFALVDRLIRIDWEALPTERNVTDAPYDDGIGYNGFNTYQYGGYTDVPHDLGANHTLRNGYNQLTYLVSTYPDAVAALLDDMGWSAAELRKKIAFYYGVEPTDL